MTIPSSKPPRVRFDSHYSNIVWKFFSREKAEAHHFTRNDCSIVHALPFLQVIPRNTQSVRRYSCFVGAERTNITSDYIAGYVGTNRNAQTFGRMSWQSCRLTAFRPSTVDRASVPLPSTIPETSSFFRAASETSRAISGRR